MELLWWLPLWFLAVTVFYFSAKVLETDTSQTASQVWYGAWGFAGTWVIMLPVYSLLTSILSLL